MPAPWWAYLVTAFAWSVPGWAWTLSTVVFYPGKLCRWASLLISFAHFYFMLSSLRLLLGFVYFPLVFEYDSRKTCFLQYKWNYVNSKSICVISLFISFALDFI